jgi:hypothetical protein
VTKRPRLNVTDFIRVGIAVAALGWMSTGAADEAIASTEAASSEETLSDETVPDDREPVDAAVAGESVEEAVEEVLVIGEKRKRPYLKMDAVTLSRIRNDGGKGARLYRQKRYEEAFPLLLRAAEGGMKMAQARVGYIYHKGLGGVERDGEAALGWIGVAASGTTSPEIRNYFKAVMAEVPDNYVQVAEEIIAAYDGKYGDAATGFRCDMERQAGTHISRLKCDHEDEWDRDDIDLEALASGISNGAGGVDAGP